MTLRVVKWGKGLAVRLPRAIIRRARLKEGDLLEIESRKGVVTLRRPDSVPTLQQLVAQITPENRYGEISTGVQVGREKSK